MEEQMLLSTLRKINKTLLLVLVFVISVAVVQAAGFESGNLTGWTADGGVAVVGSDSHSLGGSNWTVNPYGDFMARLFPSGSTMFDTATSQLGLSSVENTAIKNFLTIQSQTGGGNPNPTNAAWIKRTVELQVGVTYTFAWNYLSTDYTPFNDGSMMTLVHSTNSNITPTLNNEQQRYALLGFTNPGTGNYSTGSYGSTGWQIATITVPESGTYFLGFTAFNLGDTVLSPILFIDELQGTTTLNGQAFGPVAPNEGSLAPSTDTQAPSPTPVYGNSAITNQQNTKRQSDFSSATGHGAKVDILGSGNDVYIEQAGSTGHFAGVGIIGDDNDVSVSQISSSNARHYADVVINGSNNLLSLTQEDTDKIQFINVNGNFNTITTVQSGTGNHFLDLGIDGNNHSASITQSGSGSHSARIMLDGTQPWTFELNQNGDTGKNYTLPHDMSDSSTVSGTCNAVGGCELTVNQ